MRGLKMYQAVKSKSWPPDHYEEIGESVNSYCDAYDIMRKNISHLTRLCYGVLIIDSEEFVEISEADYEEAKNENYERVYSPDRVVWG